MSTISDDSTAAAPGPRPRSRPGAARRIALGSLMGASLLLAWGSELVLEECQRPEPVFVLLPYRPPLLSLPGPREEIAHLHEQQAKGRNTARFWTELAGAQLALAEETGDASHFRQAEASALKAKALGKGDDAGARLLLIRLREVRHEFEAALFELEELLAQRPESVDTLEIRTRIQLATGRLAEARAGAEALHRATREASARTMLARVQVQQGDDAGASSLLRRGIQLERTGEPLTSAWARAHLADIHERHGATHAPEGILREAVRIAPRAGELWRRLARAIAPLPEPGTAGVTSTAPPAAALAEARETLLTAYRNGQDPVVLIDLARIRRAEGHEKSALALLARTETTLRSSLAGKSVAHSRDLARVLLERGDEASLAEARELLEKELSVRGDSETRLLAAEAARRLGDETAAREYLAPAIASGWQHPTLERLAREIATARPPHKPPASSLQPPD